MKRIKYFALLITLTLGLIGGAYAYWTDQVVVSGTVASGHMDVRIDRLEVPNLNGRTYGAWGGDKEGQMLVPYVTGSTVISEGGKTGSVTIGNIYPSEFNTYQNIQLYIKNHSSIPVKLDNVEFTPTGSLYVWNNLKGTIGMRLKDETGTFIPGSGKNRSNFAFSDLKIVLEDLLAGVVLQPGQSVRFGYEDNEQAPRSSIIFWLEPGQGNDTQNQEIGFTVKFNWIQWNAP